MPSNLESNLKTCVQTAAFFAGTARGKNQRNIQTECLLVRLFIHSPYRQIFVTSTGVLRWTTKLTRINRVLLLVAHGCLFFRGKLQSFVVFDDSVLAFSIRMYETFFFILRKLKLPELRSP